MINLLQHRIAINFYFLFPQLWSDYDKLDYDIHIAALDWHTLRSKSKRENLVLTTFQHFSFSEHYPSKLIRREKFLLTTFQHFFLSEHYPWKLVRREKAGFMCTLLMPLMCFPHHLLSNYFTKGQKVLASTKKRRTISTMYYMDFCEHSQRRVCAMFSLWANLPCTFFFFSIKSF